MTATVLSIKATDIDNWTSKNPRRAQELLPKLRDYEEKSVNMGLL